MSRKKKGSQKKKTEKNRATVDGEGFLPDRSIAVFKNPETR